MTRTIHPPERAPHPAPSEVDTGVLFDERRMGRLAEIYAPCLTLILQLRAVDEFGSADLLRTRIVDLLRQTEREARRCGFGKDELHDVQFAIVAFVDETILSSNWDEKDHWLAKPLQLELYDRYDAGEAFFERLDEMRKHPSEWAAVLEVYYLCMALGFKGRYLLHDQEKLRTLVEDTFTELSRLQGRRPSELSPHGLPDDQVATEMKSKLPPWALAVGALVLAMIVYIGMSVYISNRASGTAQSIDEAVVASPIE